MSDNVLKSELAGSWYTDQPELLIREIDAYLEMVEQPPLDDVIALLLPHAGYRFSGAVAAHGMNLIAGRSFSRVVILGPSHRMPLLDAVSIPDVSHIETPLGRVEVDREFCARLPDNETFQSHIYAHAGEHSVQIQIPLFQRVLGDFKVVPIVCGQLDEACARRIAAALLGQIDSQTLVVASSDFTHYGRSFDYVPFADDIQKNLENLDMGAFRLIEQKSPGDFLQYVQNTGATICGRSPISVLLAMLPEDARTELLKYETSGNLTGNWSHCVSYISAAFCGRWNAPAPASVSEDEPEELSDIDKIGLLRLARYQIIRQLYEDLPELNLKITLPMRNVMGAFVTLHKEDQLRGCIGEIFPSRALHEAVSEQAVNAAFHDPRFPVLKKEELKQVDIEISALTEPRRVGSADDIEIGRHGIVLHKGLHSAVFLPQVAPEQGWGLETTLMHLSMKAGLAPDDWKSDCEFDVFEAVVFGERHP